MPTLTLHIGTAKTGTSLVQSFLTRNRKLLLERHNLLYPRSGQDANEGSHHPLAFSFVDPENRTAFKEAEDPEFYGENIRQEMSASSQLPDVLLSSECFWFSRHGLPDFIFRYFPEYSIRILMYARRIDHYVEAAWSQHVKGRAYTNSLESFLTSFRYFNLSWPQYWQNAFRLSDDAILIRPYEKRQFKNGSLIEDFMFSLCKESDLSIYKVPERISNPRLTRDALEFMLRVNAYPVSERKRASIVRKLINYSIKTDENVTKPFSSHGLLSNEQRLELLSGAEESDQEIARKYLNRASGELFADREVNNMPSNEYPGLTPDSAKELCKTILSNPVKQKKFTEFSKSESSVTELIQFTLDLI